VFSVDLKERCSKATGKWSRALATRIADRSPGFTGSTAAVEQVPKSTAIATAAVVVPGELDQRIFPDLGSERRLLAIAEKTQIEPGCDHYDHLALVASRKGAQVRRVLAAHP
jgi:hypothetical protein